MSDGSSAILCQSLPTTGLVVPFRKEGTAMVSETFLPYLYVWAQCLFQSDKFLSLYINTFSSKGFSSSLTEYSPSLHTMNSCGSFQNISYPLQNIQKLLPHPSLSLTKNNYGNQFEKVNFPHVLHRLRFFFFRRNTKRLLFQAGLTQKGMLIKLPEWWTGHSSVQLCIPRANRQQQQGPAGLTDSHWPFTLWH